MPRAILQFCFLNRQVQWFELVLVALQVHLLNDERGPVIETLIARTQRQVIFRSCLLCEDLCMCLSVGPGSSTHQECGPLVVASALAPL